MQQTAFTRRGIYDSHYIVSRTTLIFAEKLHMNRCLATQKKFSYTFFRKITYREKIRNDREQSSRNY